MQRPYGLGGSHLLLAVADADYEAFVRDHVHLLRAVSPPVRFLRTSELRDPATQADLVFARYLPTEDRNMLFVTARGELFEQDAAGLVYCNRVAVWPAPPVAFGDPRSRLDGMLRPLHEAALLFTRPDPAGRQLVFLSSTPPLLSLRRLPRIVPGYVDPSWLSTAHELLMRQDGEGAQILRAPRRERRARRFGRRRR